MANISSFFGEITFPIHCANELKEFLRNYKAPYYGVCGFNESLDDIDYYIKNNARDLTIGFWGAGRWAAVDMFERNGLTFFYPDENPAAMKLIHKLNGEALPINFVDEECGCQVLYQFDGYVDVNDEIITFCGGCEDFEYTSRNLVDLGCDDVYFDTFSNTSDFEKVVRMVCDYCKCEDNAMIRSVVEEALNDPYYDGVVTCRDCDCRFVEDVWDTYSEVLHDAANIVSVPSNQSLVAFL